MLCILLICVEYLHHLDHQEFFMWATWQMGQTVTFTKFVISSENKYHIKNVLFFLSQLWKQQMM